VIGGHDSASAALLHRLGELTDDHPRQRTITFSAVGVGMLHRFRQQAEFDRVGPEDLGGVDAEGGGLTEEGQESFADGSPGRWSAGPGIRAATRSTRPPRATALPPTPPPPPPRGGPSSAPSGSGQSSSRHKPVSNPTCRSFVTPSSTQRTVWQQL